MRKILAYLGLLLPAAASLMMISLLAASSAQAATHPTVQSQVQHYLECLDWMFSNPAKHATDCGPGHEFFLPYMPLEDVAPSTPAPTTTCPPRGYDKAAFILTTGGGYGGGGGYNNDCPRGCPSAYVTVNFGGGYGGGDCNGGQPTCQTNAFRGSSDLAPMLLQVTNTGCPSPCYTAYSVTPSDQPLVLLAKDEKRGDKKDDKKDDKWDDKKDKDKDCGYGRTSYPMADPATLLLSV